MIVIPFKRVEDLTDERLADLGYTRDSWQGNLIDIDAYDWEGIEKLFDSFWDVDLATAFVRTRTLLAKSVRGLSSQQRAISLDLLAAGIVSGIWSDEIEAVEKLKAYWKWFKSESEVNAGLTELLKQYLRQEETNAGVIGVELSIHARQVNSQIDSWFNQDWLLERPKPSQVKSAMFDLGYRLQKGYWRKF